VRACWFVALAVLTASCAGSGPPRDTTTTPPAADAQALVLWRMDETGGTRVLDYGTLRANGIAGLDTRTDFGRFHNARVFTRSMESFVFSRYQPGLDTPTITIEAWVRPFGIPDFEDWTIASRWSVRETEQSWIFGMVGRRIVRNPTMTSPGYHRALAVTGSTGQLVFAFQQEQAAPVRSYFSTQNIEVDRWTHVAVSYDGVTIRFYLDGRLDAQYETPGAIRSSPAPLLVGNFFDAQLLSNFGGDLKVGDRAIHDPVYAFEGMIDELRISRGARSDTTFAR